MKKFICLLVASLMLCMGLSACSQGNNQADYRIVRENGQCFIVFDNIAKYVLKHPHPDIPATIEFDTIQTFKDSVTKGKLTYAQKEIIVNAFPRNSDGKIPCCDFDKLYAPVLPVGGTVGGVSWKGEAYSFQLTLNDNASGYLHCLTEEAYQEKYQNDFLNFFDRDTITVTKTEDLGNGKAATYYTTTAGELMNIRYGYAKGALNFVIDKTFRLKMNNPELTPASEEIPSAIDLFCRSAEGYFHISLHDLCEDPADDWLSAFGITP